MNTLKGQEGASIQTIIGLILALLIAVVVIVIIFPLLTGAEEAASCQGMLRHIASFLANTAEVDIC